MKILITGSEGQLGKSLALSYPLKIKDDELVIIKANKEKLDLSNEFSCKYIIEKIKPDWVINCGAYTAVDKAETDKATCYSINEAAPKLLAELAKEIDATLIHYSTDYVFDGSGSHKRKEDEAKGPLGVYGASKLAGEIAIKESGCKYFILRTSWVFSDHGNNFVKTMLRLGKDRESLSIVNDQIGAPTSARLLAEVTKKIISISQKNGENWLTENSGIYHTCCAGETSWEGFAKEIFKQAKEMGLELTIKDVSGIPTSEYPTPAKRPLNSRLDHSKIEKLLSSKLHDWKSELKLALSYILEN